jgi:Sortase domain
VPTREVWVATALGLIAAVSLVIGVVVLNEDIEAPPIVAMPVVSAPEVPPVTTTTTPPSSRAAEPVQPRGTVRLPGGGTARLVRQEITADGTLPIPEDLSEASWWGVGLGARRGVTLLSGHVNWAGRAGPFHELWAMRAGDQVSVVDPSGGRWVYRVSGTETLAKEDLPAHAQQLFSQRGPHRLVLVTCGGDYLGGTEGYESNRIVKAELIARP